MFSLAERGILLLLTSILCTSCDQGRYRKQSLCADGAAEPVNVSKKGSKAKSAAQNGADNVSTYEGECWAFSSRYLKPTQAALQLALDAIEVHDVLYKSFLELVTCVGLSVLCCIGRNVKVCPVCSLYPNIDFLR